MTYKANENVPTEFDRRKGPGSQKKKKKIAANCNKVSRSLNNKGAIEDVHGDPGNWNYILMTR